MKWKVDYLILAIFVVAVFLFTKVEAMMLEDDLPLLGKVIFVDAGHGGRDPGALSGSLEEKDINLEISRYVVLELLKKGAIPYMTREEDYDLSSPYAYDKKRSDLNARIKMIESAHADLYVSIHLNSDTSAIWQGAQVFYDDVNPENKEFATIMQNIFRKKLGSKREIKEINELYLFRKVKVPGLLLEVGFISNAHDRYLLKKESYQKKLGVVITEGIINYFKK